MWTFLESVLKRINWLEVSNVAKEKTPKICTTRMEYTLCYLIGDGTRLCEDKSFIFFLKGSTFLNHFGLK